MMTDINIPAGGIGPEAGVPIVRAAVDADIDAITDVMAAAFVDTPKGQWLIPDRTARHMVGVRYCAALAAYTMGDRAGQVEVAEVDGRVLAAAIWFDYVRYPRVDPRARQQLAELTAEVCGPYADRFALLDDVFEAQHPTAEHWHLVGLGADPFWQGRGLGTALLTYRHTILDGIRAPCYVAACSHPARRLYQRHGYTDRPLSPLFLPHDGSGDPPAVWPMWRGPAPAHHRPRLGSDPGE
jgi:GNAT superfamily N-acetyltransferase